jgi:hypothetical protein
MVGVALVSEKMTSNPPWATWKETTDDLAKLHFLLQFRRKALISRVVQVRLPFLRLCESHSFVYNISVLKLVAFPTDFPPSDKKRNIVAAMPGSTAPAQISGAYESGTTPQRSGGTHPRDLEREIKRMLLLNAYPVLYIILWLPGIFNRLVEAAGHSSYLLTILQCSTQYIGLANAITYGFNEHLKTTVRRDLVKWYRTGRGQVQL